MTGADRTSSLARLQPLTTYCDDECAHKRCSQAQRQSIKGGCSPSDPASFTTDNRTFERTNISKIIERTYLYPHTNCSTPWGRNPKVIPVSFHCPEKYNQTTLSSSTRFPRTHQACDDDVVCRPLPPSRGPGLHIVNCKTIDKKKHGSIHLLYVDTPRHYATKKTQEIPLFRV